jgi:hypothetical protein
MLKKFLKIFRNLYKQTSNFKLNSGDVGSGLPESKKTTLNGGQNGIIQTSKRIMEKT